jgi:hypothetical protein
MASSGMLRCVNLVRTDVSEEHSASINGVERLDELGRTLALTSNRRTLGRSADSCHPDDGGAKILRNICSCKSHTA